MIGAAAGKKEGEKYKGSPVLRAGLGAGAAGFGTNLALRNARQELLNSQLEGIFAGAEKGRRAMLKGGLRGTLRFAKRKPGKFTALVAIPAAAASIGGALGAGSAKKK
jgi:hypothetical protein